MIVAVTLAGVLGASQYETCCSARVLAFCIGHGSSNAHSNRQRPSLDTVGITALRLPSYLGRWIPSAAGRSGRGGVLCTGLTCQRQDQEQRAEGQPGRSVALHWNTQKILERMAERDSIEKRAARQKEVPCQASLRTINGISGDIYREMLAICRGSNASRSKAPMMPPVRSLPHCDDSVQQGR